MQWLVTILLQIDKLYFTYPVFDFSIYHLIFLGTKALYLPFLLILWCFVFYIKQQYMRSNLFVKRGVHIFCVNIVILAGILLLLWPGTWAGDDLGVLEDLSIYDLRVWQHILTNIYQLLLLQLLPFPGGIIILQNIFVAICVAYSITKIENLFVFNRKLVSNHTVDIVLKLLPFLLPPIIMYQFSGYRIGLYIYLELVLIIMLIDMMKAKKEYSLTYLAVFCVLTIIVSVWRTESLFYIPIVVVCLFLMDKNVFSRTKQLTCIVCIIVGFLAINTVQNTAVGFSKGLKDYEVMSTIRPCVELLHIADAQTDRTLLDEINDVVKLDVVYKNPGINGVELYWCNDIVNKNYSDDDYSEYLSAFLQLSLRYPKIVLYERLDVLFNTFNVYGETAVTNIGNTIYLFQDINEPKGEPYDFFLNSSFIANRPINTEIRESFINYLGCGIGESGSELYRIVWNPLFACITLIVCWVVLAVKRKWKYWLICSAVVVKIPIVFLTQPAPWTMYWLSFYLLGTLLAVYGVYYLILRKKAGKYE